MCAIIKNDNLNTTIIQEQNKKLNKSLPKHGICGGISISKEHVDYFLSLENKTTPVKGKVAKAGKEEKNSDYRDVNIYFIEDKEKKAYEILKTVAIKINQYFKYKIEGVEKMQIMQYTAPSNGYDWHIDLGPTETTGKRKIGVSILLNEDYEGGELVFRIRDEEKSTKSNIGDVVAFSSFVPHKVNAITKGNRHVLVAWLVGPRFR